MIIIMNAQATDAEVKHVLAQVKDSGCQAHSDNSTGKVIIGILTCGLNPVKTLFSSLPGVAQVMEFDKPYKLVSREFHPNDTVFTIKGVEIGGKSQVIIAGPCSIENRQQIFEVAKSIKASGANILRGGAFKPRSSPYAFQGLGKEGLQYLAEAGEEYNMPVVTEVLNPRHIDMCVEYSDILQVGMRNMLNYELLKELGPVGRPVFLKRGYAAKIEDLLMSAEYLMANGCKEVILCERGIRTFETATRNTLDISAVPVLKRLTHLPIVVDPSHAAGFVEYVPSLAIAAIACGADGLMLEVHPKPMEARSDGQQSLEFSQFSDLMIRCKAVSSAIGRQV